MDSQEGQKEAGMKKNGITAHIRMSLLRRIIYPLLFLVLVLFILLRQPMLEYFVIGDADAFAPLSGPAESLTYIRTNAVDLFYTGDDYYVNGTLTGHYYYQLSDGYCRIYILKPSTGRPAEPHIEAMTVSGKLVKNPEGRETLIKDLAEALDWTYDGLASVTDPYFVNQVVYFPLQEKILFGIVVISLLLSLAGLFSTLIPLLFPHTSAAFRRLADYGDADKLMKDAEEELRFDCILREGNVALTPKYLIEFNADKTAVIPLESVLWVYEYQRMKYSKKDKREKMFYTERIVTITGESFSLEDRPRSTLDQINSMLTERYPNFFFGYSEEHERLVRYLLRERQSEKTTSKKRRR